jgi:hypothetical protein
MKHLQLSEIVLKLKGLHIPYSFKINQNPQIDELGEYICYQLHFFKVLIWHVLDDKIHDVPLAMKEM